MHDLVLKLVTPNSSYSVSKFAANTVHAVSHMLFHTQVDRNLHDAMQVARNVMLDPSLVPGGGATEMALAQALNEKAKSVAGVQQWPYRAVSRALEIIPRTLLQNCGANTIRVLTALRVGTAHSI